MDFYVEMNANETPQYIGCCYFLPSNLKENAGVANLPLTSEKQVPIGQITGAMFVIYANACLDSLELVQCPLLFAASLF